MTQEPDNSNDRMEGLLRRWGVEASAARAQEQLRLDKAPIWPRRRLIVPVAVAASLALLVGVAGTVLLSQALRERQASIASAPSVEACAPEASAPSLLAPSPCLPKCPEVAPALPCVVPPAETPAQETPVLVRRIAELERQLAQAQATSAPVASRPPSPAAAAPAASPEPPAGRGLDLFEGVQRAYLSMAAPRSQGLEARKLAARQARLLARSAVLVKTTDLSIRQTVEALEVILTRLDALDTRDAQAVGAFRRLVATRAPVARIDAVLGQKPSAQLRQWLIEARLVLAGAEDVG